MRKKIISKIISMTLLTLLAGLAVGNIAAKKEALYKKMPPFGISPALMEPPASASPAMTPKRLPPPMPRAPRLGLLRRRLQGLYDQRLAILKNRKIRVNTRIGNKIKRIMFKKMRVPKMSGLELKSEIERQQRMVNLLEGIRKRMLRGKMEEGVGEPGALGFRERMAARRARRAETMRKLRGLQRPVSPPTPLPRPGVGPASRFRTREVPPRKPFARRPF